MTGDSYFFTHYNITSLELQREFLPQRQIYPHLNFNYYSEVHRFYKYTNREYIIQIFYA